MGDLPLNRERDCLAVSLSTINVTPSFSDSNLIGLILFGIEKQRENVETKSSIFFIIK